MELIALPSALPPWAAAGQEPPRIDLLRQPSPAPSRSGALASFAGANTAGVRSPEADRQWITTEISQADHRLPTRWWAAACAATQQRP
jgi:hypothetical protein